MDKHFIGKWAGIVWQLLSTDNRKWTFEEVQQTTGLDERQLSSAIGWLAREDKIQFEVQYGATEIPEAAPERKGYETILPRQAQPPVRSYACKKGLSHAPFVPPPYHLRPKVPLYEPGTDQVRTSPPF